MTALLRNIKSKTASVGIMGLGYVGLPLAVAFLKAGYRVTGFDVDERKLRNIETGKSPGRMFSRESAALIKSSGRFTLSSSFGALKDIDCIVVCVPTPLTKHKEPDLTHLIAGIRSIAEHRAKKQLIVLTSTTYPGTTEEVVLPILQGRKSRVGRDFFLAYSPEREDPGNNAYQGKIVPRIVGGCTGQCVEAASSLFRSVTDEIVPVSSTRVAEAAKLLENIYRAVNIALVNELKLLFARMKIDIWEVIEAAKTKPFGFQPFYPGPGMGGHCIPIDPYYLTWKAKAYGFHTKFIELAGEINTTMPSFVLENISAALNRRGKSLSRSSILVLGAAYKKDIDDVRESPSLKLMELLEARGAKVDFSDPYINTVSLCGRKKRSRAITKASLSTYDCVVVVTDHSCFNYTYIAENARLVVDTRNALGHISGSHIIQS